MNRVYRYANQIGQCRPLIFERAQIGIDEDAAAACPRVFLQRKRHERTEPAVRQRVLVRYEAIVAGEREQALLARRALEQTEGESSGVAGRNRRIEDEPGVRAVPGARDLEQHGYAGVRARPGEGLHILSPVTAIEIGRDQVATTGAIERVQTDHLLSEQMAFDDAVGLGMVAASPLVEESARGRALGCRVPWCRTRGRVAGLAAGRVLPTAGIHIRAPAKDRSEQGDLRGPREGFRRTGLPSMRSLLVCGRLRRVRMRRGLRRVPPGFHVVARRTSRQGDTVTFEFRSQGAVLKFEPATPFVYRPEGVRARHRDPVVTHPSPCSDGATVGIKPARSILRFVHPHTFGSVSRRRALASRRGRAALSVASEKFGCHEDSITNVAPWCEPSASAEPDMLRARSAICERVVRAIPIICCRAVSDANDCADWSASLPYVRRRPPLPCG